MVTGCAEADPAQCSPGQLLSGEHDLKTITPTHRAGEPCVGVYRVWVYIMCGCAPCVVCTCGHVPHVGVPHVCVHHVWCASCVGVYPVWVCTMCVHHVGVHVLRTYQR